MKYGESLFDICYLLFAIISGCIILKRSKDATGKLMGYAALILGCGDAFHLVPRVQNYFVNSDFTVALGVGKLVTSITMTVFYVLVYYLWIRVYKINENKKLTVAVWTLSVVRIILCLFPQNGWLKNESSMAWGIIRNIPFVILGAVICYLYFVKKSEDRIFGLMWLYILLSFLFYIPVAVFAGLVPMLGMLMLPKTICYILMIVAFLKKNKTIS
ncbi:hypothetical protein [Butyrivibrio sp. FCS006]|uniref:hypothetical protein n=1 Tax=Butyrivibrio sp. FCS006 TaxID=1280684 RepID=UPI0003FA2F72|nr:hypothetical protein [Butyrivibrio sp. FCS006]